jgi:hypothetical protein
MRSLRVELCRVADDGRRVVAERGAAVHGDGFGDVRRR